MSKLSDFLGGRVIKRFADFTSSKEEGVVIVIACCFGVDEGVDMWFPDDSTTYDPRYAIFGLCD
jgi:hypothetical protein